jgi:hypothetical protein
MANMEVLIYLVIGVLCAIIVIAVPSVRRAKESYNEIFEEKDLPIKEIIPFGKQKIYLYNLKKEKGKIEREDWTYARIAKMVNRDIEIKQVNGELVMDVPDYSDEDYKTKVIDIIALVSNFNYARFVFKGDDKFRLYSADSEFNTKLKNHALEIINEVVGDIIERIEEGLNPPSE